MTSNAPVALQQVRKPYTITKQRERWTEEEHLRFLEALKLYGRAWRKIEEFIGTKTAVQIRSHAQKFFSKLEREGSNGLDIEIPPPRPKRKPNHPYPKKAGMNSPGSPEKEAESPKSDSKSLDTTQTPRSVHKAFRLFGHVVESYSNEPADESGVESGSSPAEFQGLEVSSEREEAGAPMAEQEEEETEEEGEQEMQHEEKCIPRYAFLQFLAIHPGEVSPWLLLTPQGSTNMVTSASQSDSPSSAKKGESTDDEEGEPDERFKRRRRTKEERSSGSSIATSSSDEEGAERIISTRLTLESQGSSSGFVPYKRATRVPHTTN